MDLNLLKPHFEGRRIAILGFGKEGQSTFRYIRQILPAQELIICDKNPDLENNKPAGIEFTHTKWFVGSDYARGLDKADMIMKSPGIPFREIAGKINGKKLTSQTALFLEIAKKQVVGITGTKGKSTTASLLFQILKHGGKEALLVGNMGIPCFDLIGKLSPKALVVFEMSSHQLEQIELSPHMAILLNIFEEHLDHYPSLEHYQQAKLNIARWQEQGDVLICNPRNVVIAHFLGTEKYPGTLISLMKTGKQGRFVDMIGNDLLFYAKDQETCLEGIATNRKLHGEHNLENIKAAAAAAILLGVKKDSILQAVSDFGGLPHRLEYIGSFGQIDYYNDSIATIPEATIAALKTLPQTSTIILGGKDRGIDYKPLVDFLSVSSLKTLVFTGEAGQRMLNLISERVAEEDKKCLLARDFEDAVRMAVIHTPRGKTCLLSPAASSYDAFNNFEERGECFKRLVKSYSSDI